MSQIIPLDLNFMEQGETIAVYLLPYSGGGVLIEAGPRSMTEKLETSLSARGLTPRQITHVLLTHIHLDHAGAAGWFAEQGAQILVHPTGAPHLVNPGKLIASATRIYGDQMDRLWGQILPVPAVKLTEVQDGEEIVIEGLSFKVLYAPGHADHHVVYVHEDTGFTGDVGGIRFPGPFYLLLPFVAPETHIEKWRESLRKMRAARFKNIAPTHYGIFPDAAAHLDLAINYLDEAEAWMEMAMQTEQPAGILEDWYAAWQHARGRTFGLDEVTLRRYDLSDPPRMAVAGLSRYWHKERMGEK